MAKALKTIVMWVVVFIVIVYTGGAAGGLVGGLTSLSASVILGTGLVTFVPLWVAAAVAGAVFGTAMVLLAELTKPKIPGANAQSATRLNKQLEPEAYRKIVFGTTAANLDIRYWEVWGSDGKYYVEVIAAATHKIHDFKELYLEDDLAVNDDGSITSQFSGVLTYTGVVEGGVGIGPVLGDSGAIWDPTVHKTRFTGCAYFALTYTYDQDKWPRGYPQRYTQIVSGAVVYDPRLDSTRGGEGPHRVDDQTTWQFGIGRMLVTGTASADPQLISPSSLTIAGATYDKIKVRMRWTAGSPSGNAQAFYTTGGHGNSSSYVKTITTMPTYDLNEWFEVTFDMAALTVGGTDWTSNTITAFRLDLTSVANVNYEIEWIVVESASGTNTLEYNFESSLQSWTASNCSVAQSGNDIGRNPALQMLWYILGWRITDPTDEDHVSLVAGIGVDPDDIDFASFIAAANDCETEGYACDCVLSCGDSHETNRSVIEASCAGKLLDAGGRYSFYINVDDTAVVAVAFDESDIVGAVEWIPKGSIKDNFQVVEGMFSDPAVLFQPRSYPAVRSQAYIDADGFERSQSASYLSVHNDEQAQKLAWLLMNENRYQGVFRAPFNYKAMLAKIWSVVTVTFGRYKFVEKYFRVVGFEVSTEGVVALTLREINEQIWTPGTIADLAAPGTGSAWDPRSLIEVSGANSVPTTIIGGEGSTADFFIDGILITWADPGAYCMQTEVQYRRATDTDWIDSPSAQLNETQIIISTTLSSTDYDTRIRHVSNMGVHGSWYADTVTTGNNAGSPLVTETRYKRSVAPPSTPTGDTPSGWTLAVPSGSDALWSSTAQKSASGLLYGVWSAPSLLTSPNARGVYAGGTAYYMHDSVTYNGGTYECIVSTTTGNAPSGTADANSYWSVIAAPGTPGEPGTPPSGFTATIDLSSTSVGVNLRTIANANGYTGLSDATITFEVESGVTITGLKGSPTGGIAIDTGVWPTADYAITLNLVIKSGGKVYGGGGSFDPYGPGGGAGDAFYARVAMGVECQTGGELKGGGGAGGRGGGWIQTYLVDPETGEALDPDVYPGAGGGGGFPNGDGDDTLGGGASGADGTTSGGGAGGTGYAFDGTRNTGNGGAGGGAAAAGTAGSASTGTATGRKIKIDPETAGAAGYAVRKNGYTVPVTGSGTITGTQA